MKRRKFFQAAAAITVGSTVGYGGTSLLLPKNEPIKFVCVGGFLGAGKSTFLWESALHLIACGYTVGFITNDQAPDLVDTAFLTQSQANVEEMAGKCFCCDFEGLISSVNRLRGKGTDVIFAEPVGSCVDLSATVLQLIKRYHPDVSIAPYTVLADPMRVLDMFGQNESKLAPDVQYIIEMQLAEADILLLNKCDSISAEKIKLAEKVLREQYPEIPIECVSSFEGIGIDSWLQRILSEHESGKKIADVDYDRYAKGEEALGWLNTIVSLEWKDPQPNGEDYLNGLFSSLQHEFQQAEMEVGHVKAILHASGMCYLASMIRSDSDFDIHTVESKSTVDRSTLILNARVQSSPQRLEQIVRSVLERICRDKVGYQVDTLRCFKPGRPVPSYGEGGVI